MPDKLDQQSEIVQLQTIVNTVDREVRENSQMLKELSDRKFPWLSALGVVAPVATVFTGLLLQSIVQVNLMADRIQQVQKSIDQNSDLQQKQYSEITTDLKELRVRVIKLESIK